MGMTFNLLKNFTKFGANKSMVLSGFLFSNFKVGFTAIIIIIILFHSINLSIQQRSFEPLKEEVAIRLIQIDNTIFEKVVELENNNFAVPSMNPDDGFFKKVYKYIVYYVDILSGVWFYGMFIFVIYKLVSGFNTSHVLKNIIIATLFVFIFQMAMGAWIFFDNEGEVEGIDATSKAGNFFKTINPVKGLMKLGANLGNILNPMIEQAGILDMGGGEKDVTVLP